MADRIVDAFKQYIDLLKDGDIYKLVVGDIVKIIDVSNIKLIDNIVDKIKKLDGDLKKKKIFDKLNTDLDSYINIQYKQISIGNTLIPINNNANRDIMHKYCAHIIIQYIYIILFHILLNDNIGDSISDDIDDEELLKLNSGLIDSIIYNINLNGGYKLKYFKYKTKYLNLK